MPLHQMILYYLSFPGPWSTNQPIYHYPWVCVYVCEYVYVKYVYIYIILDRFCSQNRWAGTPLGALLIGRVSSHYRSIKFLLEWDYNATTVHF